MNLVIPQMDMGTFDVMPAACVARGAAWLDERFPGWERHVDIGTLDIQDPTQCICGQVIPNYVLGMAANQNGYDAVMNATWDAYDEAVVWPYGFAGSAAQDYWVALIKERFDSGLLSDVVR